MLPLAPSWLISFPGGRWHGDGSNRFLGRGWAFAPKPSEESLALIAHELNSRATHAPTRAKGTLKRVREALDIAADVFK